MNIQLIIMAIGMSPIGLVAGTTGAIVKILINDEEEKSISYSIASGMFSIALSGYGSEFLSVHYGIVSPSSIGLVGLFLGLTGMLIAKGAIKLAKQFKEEPIRFLGPLFKSFKKNKDNDDTN